MKIRLILKEIAVPAPGKKPKYGWKQKGSRKNILDTIANYLRDFLIKDVATHIYDPSIETEIPVEEALNRMRETISEKLKIALKTVRLQGTEPISGYGSGGGTTAIAVYYPQSQAIQINFPYGYSKYEYDMYKETVDPPPKKGKIKWSEDQALFNAKIQKEFENLKSKKSFIPSLFNADRDLPKFTSSKTVNEKNVSLIGKNQKFTTQEDINKVVERLKPLSEDEPNPALEKLIKDRFEKTSEKFFQKVHEAGHATQNVTQADGESKRLEQLASFFKNDNDPKKPNIAMPRMILSRYQFIPKDYYGMAPQKGGAFGEFAYWARPKEIDSRIKELRAKILALKIEAKNKFKLERKQDLQQAKINYNDRLKRIGAEAFETSKNREENQSKAINVRESIHTDKIATEELREKYLYQFYLQLSIEAKEIFNSDPRYKEELERHKKAVEEINQQIDMLVNAGHYGLKAQPEEKEKYRKWVTEFEPKEKS